MEKVHNKPFFACTGASRNESSLRGGVVGGGEHTKNPYMGKQVKNEHTEKIHTREKKIPSRI